MAFDRAFRIPLLTLLGLAGGLGALAVWAQPAPMAPRLFEDPAAAQRALIEARAAGEAAARRAEGYEAAARNTQAALDATIQEAAGLAARIQQAEAGIAASEARAALIERERAQLRVRLAERQAPLLRLTAALQRLSRRPAGLALLRPGSLREAVYLRASLNAMLPEIERRTADLRAELRRSRSLQDQAQANTASLRQAQRDMAERRQALSAVESQQRLAAREAGGLAAREADRVLALAEQARDLNGLIGDLDSAARRRAELAALPGPVLRPAVPGRAVVSGPAEATPTPAARLSGFTLPVAGRLITGFGVDRGGQIRSRGITLAARPGGQVVAPGAGRIAFAGPYRGYGQIVIVEHPGGWTSLITGLATIDVAVGSRLVAGSPLGLAGGGEALVTLELRKDGQAVNPLDQLAS